MGAYSFLVFSGRTNGQGVPSNRGNSHFGVRGSCLFSTMSARGGSAFLEALQKKIGEDRRTRSFVSCLFALFSPRVASFKGTLHIPPANASPRWHFSKLCTPPDGWLEASKEGTPMTTSPSSKIPFVSTGTLPYPFLSMQLAEVFFPMAPKEHSKAALWRAEPSSQWKSNPNCTIPGGFLGNTLPTQSPKDLVVR